MNTITIDTTVKSAFVSALSQDQLKKCGERCIGYISPYDIHITTGGTHLHDVAVTIPKFSPPTVIAHIRGTSECVVSGTINGQKVQSLFPYELLNDNGVLDQCEKNYKQAYPQWLCKKAKLFVRPQDIIIASEAEGKSC